MLLSISNVFVILNVKDASSSNGTVILIFLITQCQFSNKCVRKIFSELFYEHVLSAQSIHNVNWLSKKGLIHSHDLNLTLIFWVVRYNVPITVSYLSYVFYHNFLFIAAFEVLDYLKKALKVPNIEIMAQKRLQLHIYRHNRWTNTCALLVLLR